MTDKVQGIDVSSWQDTNGTDTVMDFKTAIERGAKFTGIRYSLGLQPDADLETNYENAREAGIPVIAYHALDYVTGGRTQAEFFRHLESVYPADALAVDYENKFTSGKLPILFLNDFIAPFELETVLLYTNPSYWRQYGAHDWSHVDHCPLWIANYSVQVPTIPKPWQMWKIWQYSATGTGSWYGAESRYIDLDWFNGNEDELAEFLNVDKLPRTVYERLAALEAIHAG